LPGEQWVISYGSLGRIQNGLVLVLMPLAARHRGAARLTDAAFSLLWIFAPFLGTWADRTGRHRDPLVWGAVSSGMLLLLFDFASEPLRLLLAGAAGLGAMATTTAGNVLAIQGQPEQAWDARIALMQGYIGAGQVVGLIAAGLLARSPPGAGFIVAGLALLATGCWPSPPPRMAHPAVRMRNRHRGRWWTAMPAWRGRTTAPTTCPGRSLAPVCT
jgi:hypothetical protein